MASVSNSAYPWREAEQIGPITTVLATHITGSSFLSGSTVQASTIAVRTASTSGSAVVKKGYTALEGLVSSGSVLAGTVLVQDITNDDCVSGSSVDLPTGIIGVSLAAASAGAALTVITSGVTPKILIASGSITAGDQVGSAGLSGSNFIATDTTAGKILGIAVADIADQATGSVFVSPR